MFGGSAAEVISAKSKNENKPKPNPLPDEIKRFQIYKEYGGGMYSLKGVLVEMNNLDNP